MATDELLERNREQILRVCAKHGALNVRVFGSRARGEAGPDSDVTSWWRSHPSILPGSPVAFSWTYKTCWVVRWI